MKLRPRMIQFDRDPRTGQYSPTVALPSARDMQAAYGGSGGRLAVTPATLPTERDLGAALGTDAVRSHPAKLGKAAKAEAAEIGSAVSMFLRNYKR